MGFTVPDVPKTLDDLNILQITEAQDQNNSDEGEDDSEDADANITTQYNKSLNMAGGVTYNPETGEATVDNDATESEEDIPPIDNTDFVLDKNDIDQATLEKLLLTSPIIGEELVEEEEEMKADEEVLEDEEELEASTEDFEANSVAMIKSAQEQQEEVVAMPPPFGKKEEVALPKIGGVTQPTPKEFQPVDLASTFKESEPHYGEKGEDEPYVRWPEPKEEVGEDTKSGLSDDGDGAPPHLSDDGEGPPPKEILELENNDEDELPQVDEETVIDQEDNGYDEPEGEKEKVDIATTEEEVEEEEEEEGQMDGEENWEGFHLETKDKKIDLATVDHHKNGESHNASELQNVNDYEGDGMGYKVLPPKIRGGKGGGGHPATVALILIPFVLLCACCMIYRRRRKRLPPKGRYSAIGSDDFFNGTFSDDLSYGGKSSDDGGDWNPNDSFDSDDESNGVSLEMGGIHEMEANGGLSLDEVNG